MKEGRVVGITLLLVLCVGCLCLTLLGAICYLTFQTPTFEIFLGIYNTRTPTPVVIRPGTPLSFQASTPTPLPYIPGRTATPWASPTPFTEQLPTSALRPTDEPTLARSPVPAEVPTDTLIALEQAVIPTSDLIDLAYKLEDKENISPTVAPPSAWYQVGAQQTFWVTNVDSDKNFQVQTTLQYVTDHAYFWIEDGVDYNENDLLDLAEAFENQIYPTNRQFFGSEWTPGVDGDPHIYIVYASNLGSSLAGYYSSADEYPPQVHEYSNAHEMFLFNSDNVDLGETFTYGVLAHEFQHMIRWYQNRTEASWLNEGFSELAALLNGYYDSGHDYTFASRPDLQLSDWPNDPHATTPHYGAGFLFVTYFLDRFGEAATKALTADPGNGLQGVDDVLTSMGITDPLSGKPVTADDVVLDWMLTNYIQDAHVSDGRYAYLSYSNVPDFNYTEQFLACPVTPQTRSVHQYGADYIRLTCRGDHTIHFEGSIQANLLETYPHSGRYAFWSNEGDEADMTLTRSFDFTNQSGPLTLNYWTWYDLEQNYDYLYLTASLDGEHWQILTTPSGTLTDLSGNSFGWGYNGRSGGGDTPQWIQESVDLSQFAGKVVQLRFEYVTDAAVYGDGFLLDDVEIPQIGYFTDFDGDNGGWEARGWSRVENILPQTFRLALIKFGQQTTVEYLTLDADISADIPFSISGDVQEVVLVVTGTTRFTRQPAAYRYEVSP